MKRTILLLLLLLCSCRTSRNVEESKQQIVDSATVTTSHLDIVAVDSLVAELDFKADRLDIEFLPTGETRLTAANVTTKGRRERVAGQSSSQATSECSSHNIRDSTSRKKDRDCMVIAEPPSANRLFPILAVIVAITTLAYLALKMRR